MNTMSGIYKCLTEFRWKEWMLRRNAKPGTKILMSPYIEIEHKESMTNESSSTTIRKRYKEVESE